jgi:putative flavoprotein involved in K+ transport
MHPMVEIGWFRRWIDPATDLRSSRPERTEGTMGFEGAERVETVIVGGGQAGLATAYFLKRRGRPAVILDAFERVGDAWRTRWDSLRLFTTARYDALPGLRFPAPGWSFPTKDEMADYLESYASTFGLDVRTGTHVDSVSKVDDRFVITTTEGRGFEADNVVVATGAHRIPKVPAFAADLDPSIVHLHSDEYRRPSQLRAGGVLLVGAGNSGADIALEVVREHETWLAGRETGHIPVRIERSGKYFFVLIRFFGHHVLTRRTPFGRRARRRGLAKADPLIRVKPKDLLAAGVERVSRVAGVRDGLPMLEDGRTLEVANVIWCTGFRRDYPWLDLPVLDRDGEPTHERGVVTSEPGLYFVGLPFQYSKSSEFLPGIGRDHAYVARHIASRDLAGWPRLELAPKTAA